MFVMFFIRHKDTDLNNSEIHRFRQLTNKLIACYGLLTNRASAAVKLS